MMIRFNFLIVKSAERFCDFAVGGSYLRMHEERMAVAAFVRAAALDDFDARVMVLETAVGYLRNLRAGAAHVPGAEGVCAAMALRRHGCDGGGAVWRIAQMLGIAEETLQKRVAEAQRMMKLDYSPTFQQIIEEADLPRDFLAIAQRIYEDVRGEFPKGREVEGPLVKVAILMIISDKKGLDRESTIEALTRITSTDAVEVMRDEVFVRSMMRDMYGVGDAKEKRRVRKCPKEVRENAQREISEIWKRSEKKKVQTLINFKAEKRREKL